ncbi:MAG: potassium-transporting ATPase subunit KdpC [Candidatus Eisenbacteria bacterium]
MNASLRASFVVLAAFTLVTGVLYPLAVTGVTRVAFPAQAAGSPIVVDGRVVGSLWIGQSFERPGQFRGRPSATARTPYDGSASAGSNLGPTNPALVAAVRARIAVLRAAGADSAAAVPVDLVTASASGLDPQISPAAAEYQVARVARERGVTPAEVRALVRRHTEGPQFGVLGEPRVRVLTLNLDLDRMTAARAVR